MSLFKSIADAVSGIAADADNLIKKVTTQATLERVIYAAALIGWADGDCDADEKAKTVAVVKAKFPQFGAKDVKKHFDSVDALLELGLEFGVPDVLDTIKKCKDPEEAALIVRVAILIGGADGDFDKDEKAMVCKICKAVGINPSEYGL